MPRCSGWWLPLHVEIGATHLAFAVWESRSSCAPLCSRGSTSRTRLWVCVEWLGLCRSPKCLVHEFENPLNPKHGAQRHLKAIETGIPPRVACEREAPEAQLEDSEAAWRGFVSRGSVRKRKSLHGCAPTDFPKCSSTMAVARTL